MHNDIRPPKRRQEYTPQVEKTNVILPIDDQAIEEKPGKLHTLPSRNPFKRYLSILGPGLITGASDDDPSGIATYSVAGAQFGYQTLWLALLTYPLSVAVQEVCARIGLITGHGLAAITKRHYHPWILYGIVSLLVVANTINIGADIQAMAATIQLLTPGVDFAVIAVALTAIILLLLISLSYKTYAKFLKFTTVTLFSYVLVAFMANTDWNSAMHYLIVPTLSFDPIYLMTLVGILGTTISPYMFFWQANEEVEEEIAQGIIRKDDHNVDHKGLRKIGKSLLKDMRIDVSVGMLYAEVIMFFIIAATAATLYQSGSITNIADLELSTLALVLKPLVGDTAFFLFALGIVGIGLLAIPVLAGSASYAIAELFDWKEGLNKKFHEAKGFYTVVIVSTLVGLSLNFIGIRPVAALYYTAILNGIVAVPLLFLIWRMGNNRRILGEHTSGPLSNFFLVVTIIIMTLAAVALFTL